MDQATASKKKKQGIFGLLKPYWFLITLLIFFALISNALNLWVPKLIGNAIDSFTQGSLVFTPLLIKFGLVAWGIFLFTYAQSILQTYVSERVARDLRKKLSSKLSQQSFEFIETANPSKVLTNLTTDVDSIKSFVSQAIVSLASSLFIIVGASILLLTINWKLALTVMAIIPILGITFYLVLGKVRFLFLQSRSVIDWLNKVINESIMGSALIRVINSQQLEYEKFLAANTQAKEFGLSILRLFASLIPVIIFTSNMAGLAILVLGGHFVISGSMSLGDFAAFNSYLALLIFPILVVGFMSNVIAQASASYERISAVMNSMPLQEQGKLVRTLDGAISLKNVSLNFGQKMALKNISISVKPGSKTAIIGPTAAGKTQLLYLLTRLIRPNTGTIEFDGFSIGDYQAENFHQQVGFVFQDSIIFSMSIRENIAFSEFVSQDSVEKAIRTAELSTFIQGLPNQLDTLISERGSNLSGGQKQRIMLARALALDPKILLLDDFTARVDNQTESLILKNIQENYPNITLISVTQKVASVENYDQLIVLMEGVVIATGTHLDLMKSSPEYVQIYDSQQSTSNYEL